MSDSLPSGAAMAGQWPDRDGGRRTGARVALRGIAKHFGAVRTIEDLNLEIRQGEFITFLGPSGSGKTTTLMMIAGFETPTAGSIEIDAVEVVRLPPYKRNVGMVFQSYALFPHLTVAENIGFALKQRGVGRAELQARVAAMLDLVQLQGFGSRYPQQLSGGQQQRVAIARAVVFNPRVLLMDEPLSALDKQLREDLQLEIKRLHHRLGITFIYVTHDQREALVMSDRVAVMNHGRIEQIDTPKALYDQPGNAFVAAFVGEANFFEARAAGRQGGELLLACDGKATLRAPAPETGMAGDATCRCMVRPEKMSVSSAAPMPTAGLNTLQATVLEAVFMGEMTRYVLQTAGGQTLTVKQTHRADAPALEPAEPACISWAVADTRIVV